MGMKLAFTGDICFGDVEEFTDNPFKNIVAQLSEFDCVVNLEAVFLPKSYTEDPIKQKLCLRQHDETIAYLKKINPFLVNLANNHINDYGDFGANNTIEQLELAGLRYFGAGYDHQNHNVFISEKAKIMFLSYVTRGTDLTGSVLFNEADLIGPKEFSFELVEQQIRDCTDYKKIVLLHWGAEDLHYPLPEQREVAKKLVDMGIDLIIGNHPHVIQSFEQYRGKWIFYCLGNFFFPNFVLVKKKRVYRDIHSKERKITIVPVFDVNDQGITLYKIYTIAANEKFEPRLVDKEIRHNVLLVEHQKLYGLFYKFYLLYENRKLRSQLGLPMRIAKALTLRQVKLLPIGVLPKRELDQQRDDTANSWPELEIKYAKMLRESNRTERRHLYVEAYSTVSELRGSNMPEETEKRTAGTSEALVRSLIHLCKPGDHILEIGCGRGYTCLKLAPHATSIVGTDISAPVLNEARELLQETQISNVKIQKAFAHELTDNFGKDTFDKVISIDVYEHLHPEDAVTHLSEVYSVLKPGGEYIVVTPNRLTGPHDVTSDVFPDAKEPLGFHLNETTYGELVQQMKYAGFARFCSVTRCPSILPVAFAMVYPSRLTIWLEKRYSKVKDDSFMGRWYKKAIGRIFLIARKY